MSEMECKWIGPEGYNPVLGFVTKGKIVKLSAKDFDLFLRENLIAKIDKKTNTRSKKK